VLYVILFLVIYGIGILIGKFLKVKNASLLMNIVVYALILFLSLWAGNELTSLNIIEEILLSSILYSLTIIVLTYLVGILIPLKVRNINHINYNYNYSNLIYVFILIVGWIFGYFLRININYSDIVEYLLYVLAFFAGLSIGEFLNLKLIKDNLNIGLISVLVAVLGSILSSIILYIFGIKPYSLSLSICLGNGWYTYTGPIVASYYGSYYGTIAFLTNFLREQMTFIVVPILSRIHANPASIIAIGGATSMDTTLGLYSLILGSRESMGALISGVLLTLIIPIILPLVIFLVPI